MFQIFYQINIDLLEDILTGMNFEFLFYESIHKIENLLHIEKKYFSIILTDDEFIRNMNDGYRNKDYATDVISFPADDVHIEAVDNKNDLGEIYISVETAVRQADNFAVSIEDELKRLIVHGVLHLMGFDHEKSPDDEKIMTEIESFILSQI